MSLETNIKRLKAAQNSLQQAKEAELKIRKEVAEQILGDYENVGHELRETLKIAGYKVQAKTNVLINITDKDELVRLYLSDDLDAADYDCVKLAPSIPSASKLSQLNPDYSVLLDYIVFKISPTPTVKIEEE